MKATKLVLLVLSCMLVIGCKKNNSDEPTPPSQQTDTISAQLLKSYYPYTNMEKIEFVSVTRLVTYSVINSKLSYKDKQMSLYTTMSGKELGDTTPHYHLSLSADVTNGTVLRIDFSYLEGIEELKASYTHDITKDGKLPETIEFSGDNIKVTIKKDKGLIEYFNLLMNDRWQFRRIVE